MDKIKKILNLMERLEHPYGRIDEAKTREQVSHSQLLDWLNSLANSNSANGLFASMTYCTAANVYKTKKNWRRDDVQTALDQTKEEHGEKQWYKDLSDYNQEDVKGKNPIKTVVFVHRRTFNYRTPENFKKTYGEKYAEPLSNLRMKYGMGTDSNGIFGDNHNQRQNSDYGPQFNQTGKLSIDLDMTNAQTKFFGAYLIDEEGNISDELPISVVDAMMAKKKDYSDPMSGVEKTARETLSGEELHEYARARAEIAKAFVGKNFLLDRMLCMAASDGKESKYFINDKLDVGVNIDQSQMVQIAQEQLNETYQELDNYAV